MKRFSPTKRPTVTSSTGWTSSRPRPPHSTEPGQGRPVMTGQKAYSWPHVKQGRFVSLTPFLSPSPPISPPRPLLTVHALRSYVPQHSSQAAAGLGVAPVRVDVHVGHRLLDADTAAQRAPGEGVQGVHEDRVLWRQAVLGIGSLEHGPRRVQAWGGERRRGWVREEMERKG